MSPRLASLCLAGVMILGRAGAGEAAPQTFNTALPVAEGEFVFRTQFVARRATGDPGPADRERDVLGAVSILAYGATGDLALFAALPYLDKELDITMPAEPRVARGTNGIGDARLFGRHTVYRDDAPGRTFRIAPFLGIELPTGAHHESDGLGTLPVPLQPGSGSWDPFGGIVLTYQTLDFQVDAQAGYMFNTEANGFAFGDEARLDGSLQVRLWPRELGPGVPGFLYAVLEGNLIHRARNEVDGAKDPDSGGMSFFLAPGLQYVTKRWILEGIVQVPVVQDLGGAVLADDLIVRAGFRVNF